MNHSPRLHIWLHHTAAAVIAAVVAGSIFFAVDVAWPHRSGYAYLGDSLARVLSMYLAVALGIGILLCVLVGAVSGALRRFRGPTLWGFYFGAVAFFLATLWHFQDRSVAEMLKIMAGPDVFPVLGILAACIVLGWAIGRLTRRVVLRPGTSGVVALIVVGVVVALVLGVARPHRGVPGSGGVVPRGPNVVFILLDALRYDRLSAYGYERETSPNIDRLAREGILFGQARSHGNRTILAMPALFTSLYPSFNGAFSLGGLIRPLPDERTTLAEIFQESGYATVGVISNAHMKTPFGMTQGFDRTVEFNGACYDLSVYKMLRILGIVERPAFAVEGYPDATVVTEEALQWLDVLEDRPFFLYLHYMDIHHPYTPPREFADMFGGVTLDPGALFAKTKQVLDPNASARLTPDELATLEDYYDACIRYTDSELGRILDRVREIGDKRDTIVILTSDHGDEFMEHGSLYHNNLLIEELIRVPLVFWGPRHFEGGTEIYSLVRHLDVLPTLAQMIDASLPPEAQGTSLGPLLRGETQDLDLSCFAEGDYCTSLVQSGWKVMYVDSTQTGYLYHIDTDPRERHDLAAERPDKFREMMDALNAYRSEADKVRKSVANQADDEIIRQLKAHGYL